MAQNNVNILNWNPRGLNNKVRRDAVRDIMRDTHATIVCLQETKLDVVDDAIISSTLGPAFVANYAFIPAIATRGGIILVVSDAFFTLSDIHATANTLSATVTMLSDRSMWTISCVYGPQGYQEKLLFIDELRALKPYFIWLGVVWNFIRNACSPLQKVEGYFFRELKRIKQDTFLNFL
jgi:exonuclease III